MHGRGGCSDYDTAASRPQPRRGDAIVEGQLRAFRCVDVRQYSTVLDGQLVAGDAAGRERLSCDEDVHTRDRASSASSAGSTIHSTVEIEAMQAECE